jgi:Biopolymer transport proteins
VFRAVIGIIQAGGVVVVLLVLLSLVSIAQIVVKTLEILPARSDPGLRAEALTAWSGGARSAARERLSAGAGPIDRALGAAMAALAARRGVEGARAEIERVGAAELTRLSRHMRLLDVIAVASPLLGLLGTVLGMIEAFRDLELAGGGANAATLAGGIWQALLTTAMGLIVAIPAGAAAGLLSARVDRIGHEIEDAGARLLALEAPAPAASAA